MVIQVAASDATKRRAVDSRNGNAGLVKSTWFGGASAKQRSTAPDEESLQETVRKRVVIARNLNRLDQKDAAKKLGYRNSSPLSKIENGQAKIPKDFIVKAAIAYGVSTDYLFGLSNEPERDPKTAEHMAIIRAVETTLVNQAHALTTTLLQNAADMTPMEGHLSAVLSAAKDCIETFNKIRNDKAFINDVRGGSSLQRAIDEIQAVAMQAKGFLDHRSALVEARVATLIDARNYPLFDNGQG